MNMTDKKRTFKDEGQSETETYKNLANRYKYMTVNNLFLLKYHIEHFVTDCFFFLDISQVP